MRRWQMELEVARVRDHRELLSMGQRIESGNAAINRELAQQGATIAEVLRVIHVRLPLFLSFSPRSNTLCATIRQDINAGLQNACFTGGTLGIALPLTLVDAAGPSPTLTTASTPLAKAKVLGSGTPGPSAPCISYASPGSAVAEKSRSPTLRRLSFTRKCVKLVPLANVFSKLSSSLSFSSHSPSRAAATRSARDSPCGRSPVAPQLTSVAGAILDGKNDYSGSSTSSSCYSLPAEPPPPYQLRVANPAPEYDLSHGPAARSSSRFTAASVEAVRAPDSPVPTFPSPKLSTESVFGSAQSLASMSAWNETVISERCCTRRNTATGAGPVLKRKGTIRFGLGTNLSTDYPSVQPIVRSF